MENNTIDILIAQLKHTLDQLEISRMMYEKKIADCKTDGWFNKMTQLCLPHIERIDKRIDEIHERLEKYISTK